MKNVPNNFLQELAKNGRQIDSIITYQENGNTVILDSDEIIAIKPINKTQLLKSLMKECDIETLNPIPKDTQINIKIGLLINNEYKYINLGNFIIYNEPEYNADTLSYTMKSYDKMLYSMVDYKDMEITYPINIRDFINKICEKIGLEFKNKNTEFANYNKMILVDSYTGYNYKVRDVLDELAQVTASVICINELDELEIRYPNETDLILNEDYLKDINVEIKEKYGPINTISLSRSADSDVVYLDDPESIIENGLCELKIKDNQIMNFNDRSDYLPDILEKLNGLNYYIIDIESTGIIVLDIYDLFTLSIYGENYNCLLLNDELNIQDGISENIYNELPDETETDYSKADKTDRKINQVYIIADKANKKIESVVSEIGDRTDKNTTITQDIDSIISKIEQTIDTTREVTGTNLTLENCMQGNLLELHIYGNNTVFNDLTLSDELLLGDNTILFDRNSYIIVHSEDLKNKFKKQYAYRSVSYSIDYNHTTLEVTGYNAYSKKTNNNNRCYVMKLEAGKAYHIVLNKNEVNDTKWLYLATFLENPWENEEDENITAINYYGNRRTIYNTQNNSWEVYTNTEEIHIIFTATEEEKYLTFYSHAIATFETALICEEYQKIDLGITEPLRQLGSIYDEYVLLNNKSKIIKRVGITDTGVLYPLSVEEEIELGELSIKLANGTNYIHIPNYVANMMAKYVILNDFTKYFTSTVHFQTVITQLYNSIALLASEKIGEDEIIAKINLAVENEQGVIEIKSNLIEIMSDYFQLTKEGRITATEGEIAGLNMREKNTGSFLSKNFIADKQTYQSGFFIPKTGLINECFLYAGLDITNGNTAIANANTFITHQGLISAKWFQVNGENGYFYINHANGNKAMSFSNNGIDKYLSNGNRWSYQGTIFRGNNPSAEGYFFFDAQGIEFIDGLHSNKVVLKVGYITEGVKIYYNLDVDGDSNLIKNSGINYEYAVKNISPQSTTGGGLYVTLRNGTAFTISNSSSDKRLKENIKDTEVQCALETIRKFVFKSFDWISSKEHRKLGLIAQELKKIDENLVVKVKQEEGSKYEYLYQLNADELQMYSLKAIQELDNENKKLKKQIDNQQKTINFLINKLNLKDEFEKYL